MLNTSYTPSIKVDLIKELQTLLNKIYKTNLNVDGIIGNKTNKALRKVALKNYCSNELVKFVQVRLVTLGYSVGNYGIDGKYGNDTEKAVKQFQKNNNLNVDGIVGINTLTKLVNA